MGKTGLRQFQAIVVTWDDTSCHFGTDIEMLYSKKHSTSGFLMNSRYINIIYASNYIYKNIFIDTMNCV